MNFFTIIAIILFCFYHKSGSFLFLKIWLHFVLQKYWLVAIERQSTIVIYQFIILEVYMPIIFLLMFPFSSKHN